MSTFEEVIIGQCRLIRGDSHELLPDLTGDVLITDPPYGQGYVAGAQRRAPKSSTGRTVQGPQYGKKTIPNNDVPFDPRPWLARFPHAILWGANYFADKLPPSASWLVWDKRVSSAYDGLVTFADGELAWCSDGKPLRFHRQIWNGLIRQGQDAGTPRLHPMQKPVELMEWCIQRFPWCASIVDPFAGSFTTGIACILLGKTFIGIDIDPYFWELGCRRIEAAYAQLDLTLPHTWQPPTQERLAL